MPNLITPTFLWIGVTIVSVAIEAGSLDLTAIWFAVGALFALLASIFGASFAVQAGLFVIMSVVLLISLRPITKRYLTPNITATNADRILGDFAIVTTAIDNIEGTGEIKIAGNHWHARSADGTPIPQGMRVQILEIVGVKVVVTAAPDTV